MSFATTHFKMLTINNTSEFKGRFSWKRSNGTVVARKPDRSVNEWWNIDTD